jgi:hypothetical protein
MTPTREPGKTDTPPLVMFCWMKTHLEAIQKNAGGIPECAEVGSEVLHGHE